MYGHNIIVHGISNGRSSVGMFVTRLMPILLISNDLMLFDVVPVAFKTGTGILNLSVSRPYGKKHRKSFLGKPN